MGRFANRVVDSYTFYQWINIEYSIVKRQYKELNDNDKSVLNKNMKSI